MKYIKTYSESVKYGYMGTSMISEFDIFKVMSIEDEIIPDLEQSVL